MTIEVGHPTSDAGTRCATAGGAGGPESPVAGKSRLVVNAAWLLGSTAATSLFGFAFWSVAARLYPVGEIGNASSLISAVSLLAYLALFGMNSSLIRFLPLVENPSGEVSAAVTLTGSVGLALGLGYALFLPIVAPRAAQNFHGPAAVAILGIVVLAASVNLVTDSVFIARRAARWNPVVDGIVQGIAKFAPIALLTGAGAAGVFISSGLGSIAAAGASLLLFGRIGLRFRPTRPRAHLRRYGSFSMASYVSSLMNLAPLLVLPLITLDRLGSRDAGYYYVAFQVANLLGAIPFAVCESLFAEVSHAPEQFARLARRSAAVITVVLLPIVLVVIGGAHLILSLFGPAYASHATGFVRLLCIGAAPVALNTWASFLLRARNKMGWLIASNAAYFVVATTAALALSHRGLDGIGDAWILANTVSAAIALAALGPVAPPRARSVDGSLRVLQIVDVGWLAGGAERSVLLLRETLSARGDQIRVLSTDKNADGRELFADVVVPAITGSAGRRLGSFAFYPAAYAAVRRTIDEFAPDVIHFHTVGELSPSALFAARAVPFVVTVHGPEDFTLGLLPWHLPASDYRGGSYRWRDITWTGRARTAYLRYLQRPIYLLALRGCAQFVAPSAFMAETLREEASPARITHICNGIELPGRKPLQSGERLLYVGRLEAVKGVDVLLRAFAAVAARRRSARLVIVGDGTQRAALESLAVELGIATATDFRGWLDEPAVRGELAAATAVVIPSVWPENLPTVALEAIGVGRAIVASRVGGIPELVLDGETGILVPPGDERCLASALARVIGEQGLAAAMGARAAARGSMFAIERFVDEVRTLYEQIRDAR